MMTESRFWKIVDSTLSAADDREGQESLLWDQLMLLKADEVAAFAWRFDSLHTRADCPAVNDGWARHSGVGADDGYSDFRSWLISRGRAVYEKALTDPDSLDAVVQPDEDTHYADFGYVALGVYERRTGAEVPPRPGSA